MTHYYSIVFTRNINYAKFNETVLNNYNILCFLKTYDVLDDAADFSSRLLNSISCLDRLGTAASIGATVGAVWTGRGGGGGGVGGGSGF